MNKSIWDQDGGIYCGFACDPETGIYAKEHRLPYNGDRHVLTFGPNGSGKSMRLLYENLMTLRHWSMLVIDPKGELAELTGAERAKYGKVIYLNPYGARGLPSNGFNPVATLNPEDPNLIDDAMGLAEAMIRIAPNAQEPHWAESAQDLVCALLIYGSLQPPRMIEDLLFGEWEDMRTLAFVRKCLGLPAAEMIDLVTAMRVTGVERDIEELSIKAARFIDIHPDNRELLSIMSTAATQTRWLDSRPIKADTSKGAIDFAAMKREPTTIYLILPANRLVTQSTWLRLVITCCLQKLIRDAVPGDVPVMLMLDEFATLGHLPMIENTMALMRGYGVKLWSVFQDLAQLKAIYGERWESFISNAGVVQAFAPQDTVTAEYLSTLSGQTTAITEGSSTSLPTSNQHGTIGKSQSQIARPVLWPGDLRAMKDGFLVVYTHKVPDVIRAFAPYPSLPTA